MKSVLEYLHECKQMADHNRLCYSATYGMDMPKSGYEKEFREAVRDSEIVDELIAMVSNRMKSYTEQFIDRIHEYEAIDKFLKGKSPEELFEILDFIPNKPRKARNA